MALFKEKIGFIGSGNMCEAMVGAVIKSDIFDPSQIICSDISKKRLEVLATDYGIRTTADNGVLFNHCDIVVLSVKPQHMVSVLSEIVAHADDNALTRKLVISIAAGIKIKKIEDLLYSHLDDKKQKNRPIIRVMPNTPALVLKGMSGMSYNSNCTEDDIKVARTILGAMGKVTEFKENDLDAVTALSGSGPAYVFYFVEALIRGGIELGINADVAEKLTVETIKGAITLLTESGATPASLRQKVAAPGGTTEAALNVFEKKSVQKNIVKGIIAAAERSKELSRS